LNRNFLESAPYIVQSPLQVSFPEGETEKRKMKVLIEWQSSKTMVTVVLWFGLTVGLMSCNGSSSHDNSAAVDPGSQGAVSLQSGTPSPSPTVSSTPTVSPISVSGVTPSWLENKSLNQWIEIPNTSGAGGAAVDAWGSLVLRDDTNELFILASGGHGDSADNRVVSIRLTDDSPQWVLRNAPSPPSAVVFNVPYYTDGKPSSRHNYQHNHWVPGVHRLMMIGARAVAGSAWDYETVDGFNPDTNTWDPAGTWPTMPAGTGFGTYRERNSNFVWTTGLSRLDVTTGQVSSPITHSSGDSVRWPVSQDSVRNQLFSLQYGDSQGYSANLGVVASRIPLEGNTQYKVTFNPSAALTQFLADAPAYPAMDYDSVNDQFLFYDGHGTGAGRIFVIKPNSGNTWDMSILPLAAGSAAPPPVPDAGVNGRFLYVPALKGFVLLPSGASNLWFIRTSN